MVRDMTEALIILAVFVAFALYGAIRRGKRTDQKKPEDIYPHW